MRKWTCFVIVLSLILLVTPAGLMAINYSNFEATSNPSSLAQTDWLWGWDFRIQHEIEGVSGAGNNYQVKIRIHFANGTSSGEHVYLDSNCQTDFADIRFTADDGVTLLGHWFEGVVESDYASCWVKVSANLDENQMIYLYFGNEDAVSTSSGEATFFHFDDFNDGFFDTSKWKVHSDYSDGNYEETDGELHVYTNSAVGEAIVCNGKSWGPGVAIETRIKWDEQSNDEFGFDERGDGGSYVGDAIDMAKVYRRSDGKKWLSRDEDGSYTSTRDSSYTSYTRIAVKWWLGTAAFTEYGSTSTLQVGWPHNVPDDECGIWIYCYGAGNNIWLDWIYVRKNQYSEPDPFWWGEVELSPPEPTTPTTTTSTTTTSTTSVSTTTDTTSTTTVSSITGGSTVTNTVLGGDNFSAFLALGISVGSIAIILVVAIVVYVTKIRPIEDVYGYG